MKRDDTTMKKIILVTGATDGIGLATAKMLVAEGHHVLIHGRNAQKLSQVEAELKAIPGAGDIQSYRADLSSLHETAALADAISAQHNKLDVIINNAGVYKVGQITSVDHLDVRFVVNTIAPYLLTQRLMPLLGNTGRVVNLSSAAQASVNLAALASANAGPADGAVYAQSKLAITMWSVHLATTLQHRGPAFIAVNPASFLGSKLVKEAYGMAGADLNIGADILCRAALSDEFAHASGRYFDNDQGQFTAPHADALNIVKNQQLVAAIESIIAQVNLG